MTLLQHYYVSLMLIAISSVLIGVWAAFQKGNGRTTRFFLLYSATIAGWGFCQAHVGIDANPAKALWWARIMFYPVLVAPVLLMHFFAAVLKEKPIKSSVVGWALLLGFVPFLHSDVFIHAGGPVGFLRTFPRAGPLFIPFNIVWIGWVTYALSLLAKRALNESHPQRKQARFLLLWFAFGYIAGSINYLYLYNICLIPFQPFASYAVSISWAILAYGVFAYQIFDARVVIQKSLIYSLLVGTITTLYFGTVLAIERVFQQTFGYHSLGVTLVAFAIVAVLFQPLKFMIQRVVDRMIFRVPQQTIAKRLEMYEERARQGDRYKAVATLAAGIAHELKNPLTSMKTFLEFFPERHDDPTFREQFLTTVGSSVERLEQITHGLLDFSKPHPLQTQPVDLKAVLNDVLTLTHHELQKKALTVTTAYTHNGSVVQGDASKLKQCFLNLVLNAKEAMSSGGTLTIFTGAVNGHLEVHIADTGCGIHPRDIPHLFEPFFSKKASGHGLGLSIVQSIVREHRGTIAVHSTPGRGTTFTITLPVFA